MTQPDSIRRELMEAGPGGLPARRILAVVTTGGFTHAGRCSLTPILEVCRLLAARGHTVEFATLGGQESWASGCPFLSAVHVFDGRCPTDEQTEAHYRRMLDWDPSQGLGPIMQSKYLWDSFWTAEYAGLKQLVNQSTRPPNLILADFFAEAAAKDMMVQFGIPVAVMWPQMPFLMAPVPYIPGQPGFQVDMTLTSEHASVWSRLRNELVVLKALPAILAWMEWTKRMRRAAGVTWRSPAGPKPGYLILVNSFFGLEVPKDLPPLIAPVGPILDDDYPPLSPPFADFLRTHNRTLYVALGTHILLPTSSLHTILYGLILALDAGYINGVIWSIGQKLRDAFNRSALLARSGQYSSKTLCVGDFLDGKHADEFLFPLFAPQRAVLDHPHCRLYLTHGGGSSANEALFHGTPVLTLGFFFDQLCNSARLAAAGVGLQLDKANFSSKEICDKVGRILDDVVDSRSNGPITRNVERMRRIARVASRRKYLAVDLIEEVLYDAELRFDADGHELRPTHLQTADARMSVWRAKNWDLWALGLGCTVVLPLGLVFAIGSVRAKKGDVRSIFTTVLNTARALLKGSH
ncbi:udp-glucosyl transferase family protein [Grosmannia clavigera kw1407]|uniref:Udp-glucosyl transferase family protein n=1 Tax=Grosmannia clavigera (strain kw1407 / UAMH 11150) TaxID=655863 RepID=F0XUJ1_GROCL|nr:udp-glucosyl transferase family protein [Grosmannia clavigera kw1407]EFW98536.1 udp-glucosyl transferase family protein [Grosmannia clavigera kw1407]